MTKDVAILSFAFNENCQRLGCIINNVGLVFMEAVDDFKTEKIISRSSGEKLYYLPLFKEWITTDQNTVYFWDWKEEKVHNQISETEGHLITTVCEIPHLRALAVAMVMNDD